MTGPYPPHINRGVDRAERDPLTEEEILPSLCISLGCLDAQLRFLSLSHDMIWFSRRRYIPPYLVPIICY